MESSLEELWKIRVTNQESFSLGSSSYNDIGIGFNDRLLFNVPHNLLRQKENKKYDHWLYSVYFRDISNYLNPSYRNNKSKFEQSIKLSNCTEYFKKTFFKYIDNSARWDRNNLLEVLGNWGNKLLNYGQVINEFVGWYDNDTKDCFAYQIEPIEVSYCQISKDKYEFKAPKLIEGNKTKIKIVEIPIGKCIVITWPKELGGISRYQEKTNTILALGNKIPSMEESIRMQPGEMVRNAKEWEMNFDRLISEWGNNHPNEETTPFYKEYNYFLLKGTLIYCTHAIIDGLKQIIAILNNKFGEEGILSFQDDDFNIDKYIDCKSKFLSGKMSFTQANEYLKSIY